PAAPPPISHLLGRGGGEDAGEGGVKGARSDRGAVSREREGLHMLLKDLIRRIRKIEIATRRAVEENLSGQYHSVFKGRGMDFSEVRAYEPGDEIRAIDWNVTARMNAPYVKRFVEERELTVMILC